VDVDGALLVADKSNRFRIAPGMPFRVPALVWVAGHMITIIARARVGYATKSSAVIVPTSIAKHFVITCLACGLKNVLSASARRAAALATMNVYDDERMYANATEARAVLCASFETIRATCRFGLRARARAASRARGLGQVPRRR